MNPLLSDATTRWLLAGDPTVVWQVQRDLLGRAASTWQATRRKIATQGWGARLLARRAADGTWGGGLYNPKWTSTFYTLQLLTQLGLAPNNSQGRSSCRLLLREGVTTGGGVSLWPSRSTDTCVTAMLLHMACHFGFGRDERVERMTQWLLGEQMSDGGWNCRREHKGATHSSFHTTISTLEALAALPATPGRRRAVDKALRAGREFFLQHQLYRSSSTGGIVRPSFSQLSFPPRWYFDLLRGLEHFAMVRANWDPRLADPVAMLDSRRDKRDRWHAQNPHPGLEHFQLEAGRAPSRINTLRALRVLSWVNASRPG
jgi:hypothetical protein